ncbi:MAG: CxxxxCH/CxxCH domain c-type cytochrome, partial [Thermodesulfovibrionales bacterium]
HSGLDEMKPVYGDTGHTALYTSKSDVYGFNCGNCHPSDPVRHQNGLVEISLFEESVDGLKARNSRQARYDSGKKTCTGVYCHSSGTLPEPRYAESQPWNLPNSTVERCQSCHGSPPSYSGSSDRPNGHFNANRGSGHLLAIHWDSVGGYSKESFALGTATQMGCSTCHYETVRSDVDTTFVDEAHGLFTCSRCHDRRSGEIFNRSVHVNGRVDVTFPAHKVRSKAQMIRTPLGWERIGVRRTADSYDESSRRLDEISYDAVAKSCENVSCHLYAKRVYWSEKVECSSCHGDFMAPR